MPNLVFLWLRARYILRGARGTFGSEDQTSESKRYSPNLAVLSCQIEVKTTKKRSSPHFRCIILQNKRWKQKFHCNYHQSADPGTSGGSRKFWWGGIWSTKPQKFGCLHQNWEWFFGRNRKFKRFFAQIQVVSRKKKVFTKIESDFSAEIGNSNVFFAQIQVVSKKKKKKVFTTIESDFSAEIGNSNLFSPKFRWFPEKKKKKRSSPKLRLIFRRIGYV